MSTVPVWTPGGPAGKWGGWLQGGPCWLPLPDVHVCVIPEKWWVSLSWLGFKDGDFQTGSIFPLPVHLAAVMKQAAMLERPTVVRNQMWSLANSQRGTEARSPPICEELNLANSHMNLEVDPSPPKSWDNHIPVKTLTSTSKKTQSRGPSYAKFWTHRNCEINVCCFKLPDFEVIYYAAIDK